MRGVAYAVAAIVAVGIMIFIASNNADQATDSSPEAAVAETQTVDNAEVVAASATPAEVETQQLTLAVRRGQPTTFQHSYRCPLVPSPTR